MPGDSTLTLFIPDLFGFQSTLSKLSSEEISQLPKIELPILEKWLSRGLFEKRSNQEDSVFLELGLGEYKNKPFAALSLLAEKATDIELDSTSYWLRADPVNLQPDRDTALMAGHEELALTQDEADKLVSQINAHFADEPWQLYTFAPHRWYLRLEQSAILKTSPLSNVLGEDINSFMPTGDDADYWFKIVNELQMLIHGSNVNFERESRNMWTANSVWLWGGGCLPEIKLNSYYDRIITDNLIYSGIGYHSGFDVLPLKHFLDSGETFSKDIKISNNVIVLDILSEQVQRRDLYTFVQTLNKLEEDYLNPCNDSLTNGSIRELKIITDAGIWIVTRKQLGRWWKRTKAFSSLNYE